MNCGAFLAAATAFFALAPAGARAVEQAIPFHGQNSAIFVEGDPLIHWIGDPTDASA